MLSPHATTFRSLPRAGAAVASPRLSSSLPRAGGGAGDANDPLAAEIARCTPSSRETAPPTSSGRTSSRAPSRRSRRRGQALADGRPLARPQRSARLGEREPRSRRLSRGARSRAAQGRRRLREGVGAHGRGPEERARGGPPESPRRCCARRREGSGGDGAPPGPPVLRVEPGVRTEHDAATPALFYLGSAQAARDFAQLSRRLSVSSKDAAPPLRALGPELDALEGDLLAAYRPPVSVERHPEFIAASSALNDARKLDAAGLRYGALLRYLQAAQRTPLAALRPPRWTSAALRDSLRETARRGSPRGRSTTAWPGSSSSRRRRTWARRAAHQTPAPPRRHRRRRAPGRDAALLRGPRARASARPRGPRAEVTVTLVRWPFT